MGEWVCIRGEKNTTPHTHIYIIIREKVLLHTMCVCHRRTTTIRNRRTTTYSIKYRSAYAYTYNTSTVYMYAKLMSMIRTCMCNEMYVEWKHRTYTLTRTTTATTITTQHTIARGAKKSRQTRMRVRAPENICEKPKVRCRQHVLVSTKYLCVCVRIVLNVWSLDMLPCR